MNDRLILACGSMGNLAYVLLTAVIFLGVGSVLWIVNLCLSLTLDNSMQQLRHFLFALLCLGVGAGVCAFSERLGFIVLVLGAHGVPLVVIAHFAYLMTLRRRQREQSTDPAQRLEFR
jgi:hypothetical protein